MAELTGKVALITGGGRGIGRVIAETLAAEGAAVAVVARSAKEVEATASRITQAGGRARALAGDVTDQAAVERVVATSERDLGPLDLLVNNAGTCRAIGPLWDCDPGDWWTDIETNVRGTFLCSRAVLPGMLARGHGRIVNVSSYVAIRPSPYTSAYAAGKAAVLSLTEGLAAAAREAGIRVFAVTPGLVRTGITEHMLSSPEGRKWLPTVGEGRWLEPERAGRLVTFLASGKADGLTGRFLHVLDDYEELAQRADEIRRADLYALRLAT